MFIELLRAALKTAVLMRSRSGVLLNGGRVVPPVPPASALAEPGAEEDQGAGDEADALMNMLGGKGGEDEGPAVPNRPQRWWKGSRSGTKLPLPLSTCDHAACCVRCGPDTLPGCCVARRRAQTSRRNLRQIPQTRWSRRGSWPERR